MPLSSATRLGPYEILAPLGAGGMGEVYRARDTRLGRDVAIKVLPQHLNADPELRARFEREARTVSSLNHPGICMLFDVGREGDTDYLVMELIEGETLAARITQGPLPVADVIRLGAQIADALARAHRAGIVHRDLKPGNVMLTKTGVKLMDFGLARSTGLGPTSPGTIAATQSPTAAAPLTAEGTIVGTFHYMAPEQLEGREADARSDLWALGCVLYEMATGRRAFDGATQASLISAIMRDTPRPLGELQPMSPPGLARLVSECLAKDPDDRWQSARDLARELRRLEASPASIAGVAHPVPKQSRPVERATWITIVAILGAGALFLASRRPPGAQRVISSIVAPPGLEFDTRTQPFAVSPDGRRIAVVCSDSNGTSTLWVRSFDQTVAHALTGTEGAQAPFWSPDGQDLGFFAGGQLKRISLAGGMPQALARATTPEGGCWTPAGDILFADTRPPRLMRVSKDGGAAIAVLDSAQLAIVRLPGWPIMLPDGNHFLFNADASFMLPGAQDGVYLGSLRGGGPPKLLVPDARNPIYRSSGHLLYWRSGILWAQRFDASRPRVSNSPERVADNVAFNLQIACAQFSAAAAGPIAYLQESNAALSELCWVDRAGRDLGTVTPPAQYYWPRLSHDGSKVVVDLSSGVTNQGDIWTFDVARGLGERLTSNPLNETSPIWANDDSRVYWSSAVETPGGKGIHSRFTRGRGEEEVTYRSPDGARPFDFTPDGSTMIIGRRRNDGRGRLDVMLVSLADGKTTPILDSDANETAARLSPDGHWLLYLSDETGRFEVYVQRFPEGGEKWRISTGGGDSPLWRRDGREIFYGEPNGQLMRVSFRTAPRVEIGSPVRLFRKSLAMDPGSSCFDVSPDGQRFLINRLVRTGTATSLVLDQGWSPSK